MTRLRLAVFDVDGTLVDSQHNIVAAMEAAFRTHGVPLVPPPAVRRVIGLSLVEAIAALLPDHDGALHHRVAQSYKEAFFDLRRRPDHDEPLFAGALDALAALEAEGWLLGIATGKSRRGVRAMVERHGLDGRFVTVQTADDNPGKPHPGMLLSAMAEMGADPESTLMIGDTVYDMLMAMSAKVAGIGVAWGYHSAAELTDAGAAGVAVDYADVPRLAEEIARKRTCALA